ncbi:MAG: 50S ribosomal protein L15 [bacterium]
MRLDDLRPAPGSRKRRKRVGRGEGSGHGKTSCRGSKGQKARSGGQVPPGFEGGQMPLQRRLPKRGFKSPFKKHYAIVHVGDLDRFEPGSILDPQALMGSGLVKKLEDGVKLLSDGEVTRALTVRVHKVSDKARAKIEAAGGKVEVI